MANQKYVWLIGENKGQTHDNNSYFFWLEAARIEDEIQKFYVLEKNEQNELFKRSLPEKLQKLIVWKDSLHHYQLYSIASMGIVSLSYLDVVPEKLLGKKKQYWAQFPIIYLQHGVTGQKKIGYTGDAYNGNLCRFIYYNRHIKSVLVEENNFRPVQLAYGVYFPRYVELLRKCDKSREIGAAVKRVLWFVTWRDYKNNSVAFKKMMASMFATFESEFLMDALERNDINVTLCLHRQMMGSMAKQLSKLSDNDCIDVVNANDADVLSLIAESDALITDYSSVAYDFAFLNKPVILYAPDYDDYSSQRGLYYEKDEVCDCLCCDLPSLIKKIDEKDWRVPCYFRDAFPEAIDYEKIKNGAYIRRLYDYCARLQRSEITFLGYNFYGTGGTVSATRSLAEALFDEGFLIRMLSLKGSKRAPKGVKGIRYSCFYMPGDKSRIQRLKLCRHRSESEFEPIKYDCLKDNLVPYAGYALKEYLASSASALIISTRESFHGSLLDSSFPGKKGYFWHTRANAINEIFPGLMDAFDGKAFSGSLFTTFENREELESLGVKIPNGIVLGNTLRSDQILDELEVSELRCSKYQNRDEFYQTASGNDFSAEFVNCVTLMRISEERRDAISRIFEFASYVISQGMDNHVRLYVYGDGDCFDYFIKELYGQGLQGVVRVMGKTNNPASVLRKADFLIDFSDVQSFGMPTIEALFNGCIPLVRHNVGSDALIESGSPCFWSDISELGEKICLNFASNDEEYSKLRANVNAKYSPEILAHKFIESFELQAPELEENCL